MRDQAELMAEIEAFLAESGMAKSAFGLAALNDAKLVEQLRSGSRSLTFRTAARIRNFIAAERTARAS